MKIVNKKIHIEDTETVPSRWQRRERKAKPKMRVHGRGMKILAGKIADKTTRVTIR